MGTSLRTGEPVASTIVDRLPATLELAFLATLVSLVIAIPAGVLSAVRRNGFLDAIARVVALAGLSVPNFLLGTLLMLFISTKWPVLPVLSLGALLAASITRMTRSALLEELGKEYLTVARAKGLTGKAVVFGHAFRNGLVPVVTIVGIQTGYLLGGTVTVEQLFAIPGVGRLALDAVLKRDYPLVQGTTLFIAGTFVLVNLLTDVIYGLIDRRIRRRAGRTCSSASRRSGAGRSRRRSVIWPGTAGSGSRPG